MGIGFSKGDELAFIGSKVLIDAVEQDATEDIHKMSGAEALHAPYLTVNFWTMLHKRSGWLSALFLGEMPTATAMTHFENQIARAVVLALFIPLIISTGGNSGSQSAAFVIRSLALGELTLRDWRRVLLKEFSFRLNSRFIPWHGWLLPNHAMAALASC